MGDYSALQSTNTQKQKVIDVLHKKNFGHFAHMPYLHTWYTMTADSSVYTSCTQLADSAKWIIDTSKYQAQTHDVINRFMYMCLEILHPIFGTSIMCSSGSFTLSMVLIHG